MHICYAALPDCKNKEESYGEICVLCNKCGRWNELENPRPYIQLISQFYSSIPPFWEYPDRVATYHEGKWSLFRGKGGKHFDSPKLTDVMPECWQQRELAYVRWWIEGRNW